MNSEEAIKRALAGGMGQEARTDAILFSVQDLLAGSREGVLPGFNLGVSGIYPSYVVHHKDAGAERQEPEQVYMSGWECKPSWDNRTCVVTPAAYTQEGVTFVPTIDGTPMHARKPNVPMHGSGGLIALECDVSIAQDGNDFPQTLLGVRLASYRLNSIPPVPYINFKIFGDSDRVELAGPFTFTSYNTLAWYGADGVLFGGSGFGQVTNVTSPGAPGFGRVEFFGVPYNSVNV